MKVPNGGKWVTSNLLEWLGRLFCLVGLHDHRLIEVVGSFGSGGQQRKVECRRCGMITTRCG